MKSTSSKVNVANLAGMKVFFDSDKQLALGQLWKNQTAVLVFLRHFACIACRAHAAQVWQQREKFESGGAKIVFVGNGQPEWMEKFREDLGIDKGVIVTDPSLKSFKAAGFKNGIFKLFQPQSAINAVKLAAQGHSQKLAGPSSGSHLQMGGIIAINPKNQIIYHFVSEALGDFPEEPYGEIISQDEKHME